MKGQGGNQISPASIGWSVEPFLKAEGTDMSQLFIKGGRQLDGEVQIQGAKNSVLPILAATLLTGDQVALRRCPHLRDVEASIRILRALGCRAWWEGETLVVDTAPLSGWAVSDLLMREMRYL